MKGTIEDCYYVPEESVTFSNEQKEQLFYIGCKASEATSPMTRIARFFLAMQTRSKRVMASVQLPLC
jgi:hypothetical protein